tara:strand:+ start:2034 stop:3122 length:1089 start_codon:yes stop_codon:yes gene_type:complete
MSSNGLMERPDWVSPPGDTITTLLEEHELSLEEFAVRIGRTQSIAQKLLDGKHSIDIKLAQRLAKVFGASETFWMAREHDYRASMGPQPEVAITSFDDLIGSLPLVDMKKFGWVKNAKTRDEKIAEIMDFFGVSTLAQWQGRYSNAFRGATYRRSAAYASCEISTTAWLRQGEIETQDDQVLAWSPARLRKEIESFRRLTWYKSPDLFLPRLKDGLGMAGVKFAITRCPRGCSASGAVRILSDGTPHIQLSGRYLSDDQFWFSLFHEIAHLLLHFDKMPIFENDELAESQCETEANDFASQVIVPSKNFDEMLSLGGAKYSIIAFAKKIGIAPGLVVGQLQHAGVLRYNQMQHLKRRYRWID